MLPDQNRSKQNRAVTLSQLQRDLMKVCSDFYHATDLCQVNFLWRPGFYHRTRSTPSSSARLVWIYQSAIESPPRMFPGHVDGRFHVVG